MVSQTSMPVQKILLKLPRSVHVPEQGRDIQLSRLERHPLRDLTRDYHTKYGAIPKTFFKKPDGSRIQVGKESFVLLTPTTADRLRFLGHDVQIVTAKDVGAILTGCGLDKSSVVVEAGSGSGALALSLAAFVKRVSSFDVNAKMVESAKANAKEMGLLNITFKIGSIYEPKAVGIRNADALILDVSEPWRALETAKKTVRVGGKVAAYTPQILQAREFVLALGEHFLAERTIEVIEREWALDKHRSRPVTKDFGHSAFLSFARKIG